MASSHPTDKKVRAETSFEHAVSLASALVSVSDSSAIRSARVVGGRRLTGAELIHLQADARDHGVRLTMDAAGIVAVRRTNEAPPLAEIEDSAESSPLTPPVRDADASHLKGAPRS